MDEQQQPKYSFADFKTQAEAEAYVRGILEAAAFLERSASRRGPGADSSALLANARRIRKLAESAKITTEI